MLKDDPKWKPRSRIFLSIAIIMLCAAMKCRDANHLTNCVYDRRMIGAQKLNEAIAEACQHPAPVPVSEYTSDVDTHRGRARGKTRNDFFRDEQAALHPRQIGLFNDLVCARAERCANA